MKSVIVAVAFLVVGIGLWVQTARLSTSARQQAVLLARVEAAEREAATANAALAKAIRAADTDPRNAEIARLRAELAALRRQHTESAAETERLRRAVDAAAQAGSAAAAKAEADEEPEDPEREAFKTVGIAKLNYGKQWALAFILYAQEHGGRMPATLEEATPFFATKGAGSMPSTVLDPTSLSFIVTTEAGGAASQTVIRPDQYEIMYRGGLDQVANPGMTIVMREKEPFQALNRPGLARTYVFADGHSEIHLAPDGDFTGWERERLVGGGR